MKKILTAGISVAMACTITVSALCGCANQTSPDLTEVSATSVDYNADGVYTTRLLGADFSGVTKDDIKVYYDVFDYAGYRNALPYASDETQDNSTDVDANAEPALSNDLPADPGVDVEKFAEVKQA